MKSWVLIPLSFVSVSIWAQACVLPVEKSAPNERFQLDGSDVGVVIDLQTGLSWQRCAVGREIDDANTAQLTDDTCELIDRDPLDGVADINDSDSSNDVDLVYNWYDAHEFAESFGDSWRLPNIKELASLVETACFSPALNSHVFPTAALEAHWSSTPDTVTDSSAWAMDFELGTDESESKNGDRFIYLVRD